MLVAVSAPEDGTIMTQIKNVVTTFMAVVATRLTKNLKERLAPSFLNGGHSSAQSMTVLLMNVLAL